MILYERLIRYHSYARLVRARRNGINDHPKLELYSLSARETSYVLCPVSAPRGRSPREDLRRSRDRSIGSDGRFNLSKQFDVPETVEIRVVSKGPLRTPTFDRLGSLEFEPR